MKSIIFFLIVLSSLFFISCNEGRVYKVKEYSKLNEVYHQLVNENFNPPIHLSSKDEPNSLNDYLDRQEEVELDFPIIETKESSLYGDLGVFVQEEGKEDTTLYIKVKPKFIKVGFPGNEHWVVGSAECIWIKRMGYDGIDISPMVSIDYRPFEDIGILTNLSLVLIVNDANKTRKIYGVTSFESKEGKIIYAKGRMGFAGDEENLQKSLKVSGTMRGNGKLFK